MLALGVARMTKPSPSLSVVRRDPAARAAVSAWRRLTTPDSHARAGPGAPTLVGVSGGADSTGLLLALAASKAPVHAVHVMHDLRPSAEVKTDRDAVVGLCERLGVPVTVVRVRPRRAGGNAESTARRLRYAAMARVARRLGLAYVATAHHAHDQVESVLMHLLRGAGPHGLAGAAAARPLAPGVTLIRPMLRVTPDDARRWCRLAGVTWREDATNADLTRTRAALRSGVLPGLLRLSPRVAERIADAAVVQHRVAGLLDRLAAQLKPDAGRWLRSTLREADPAVLGAFIRRLAARRDRAKHRQIDGLIRAIRSRGTDPKVFAVGGLRVRVTARDVMVVS